MELSDILAMDSLVYSHFKDGTYELDASLYECTQSIYLIRVYRRLISKFGFEQPASNWLRSLNPRFDEQKPIDVLREKDGPSWVMSVLEDELLHE